MADENLLHALAAQERERMQARPQEWDELAHGQIAPGEAVARVQARGTVDEGDLVHARELFTPPTAAFDDALVDRLVAMAQTNAPASTAATQVAAEVAAAPVNGNTVVHVEPSWWQRRRAIVAAGVMAAAAAVLVVAWPRAATDDTGAGRVALPHHEMWIEADAQVRGSADSPQFQRLAPGAAFRVYLRPDRGYDVKPSVAACLRKGDETRVLSVQTSAARPGETFDVATRVPDDLGEGRWELVTLVAGGALPSDIEASCAIPPADLQVARKSLDVAR
jgi:hypothetical protein